jgi:hypothetical protein
MNEPRKISPEAKVILWIAAWTIALIVTGLAICRGNGEIFGYCVERAWAFPMGTIAFFLPTNADVPDAVPICLLIGGWTSYIALTVFGLRQSGRSRFFIAYAILCLLLILNAVGCNVNLLKGGWHP